ncbi:MAG: dTMP kinase [Planctomycetota bacterium]
MSDPLPSGCLITLDGIDGVGKSTQIQKLADRLRSMGREVALVRDPGSTEIGKRLRALLLDSDLNMHRRTEAMLFMASRCEMIEQTIRPALASGTVVISDRFLLANVVYQSVGGDVAADSLWEMGRIACGGLVPDLTLLLDLPVDVAWSRIEEQQDRMESRGPDYLSQVRDAFLRELSKTGGDSKIIDAAASVDTVAENISKVVREWFRCKRS